MALLDAQLLGALINYKHYNVSAKPCDNLLDLATLAMEDNLVDWIGYDGAFENYYNSNEYGKHYRRTILRQYHPVRTQLPQDRRIRTHPATHHPARRKADGDTDRSAERDLRKVQGQHIGDQQYDGGNCLFTRIQVGAAIDRRVVYRQRSEARNITQTTDLATGKTCCRGRLFHRV